MSEYVKYFVIWLFFMALIAGITLLVPKIAKPVERWIKEKRKIIKREEELTAPPDENTSDDSDN